MKNASSKKAANFAREPKVLCFLLFAIYALLFISCSGPVSDDGDVLIIRFAGGNQRAVSYPPKGDLFEQYITHEITLNRYDDAADFSANPTYPKQTITRSLAKGDVSTQTIAIDPGFWDITVVAKWDGTLYAQGNNTVTKVEGQSCTAQINMSIDQSLTTSAYITISTQDELELIGSHTDYPLSGNYLLANNITITDTWTSIGGSSPFTGIFDGNGKTITMSASADYVSGAPMYTGLFGTNQGTIKNFRITGNIQFSDTYGSLQHVGVVAGLNDSIGGGTIENVHSTVRLLVSVSSNAWAGGIAGENLGTIRNCYYGENPVTANGGSGNTWAGGITGHGSGSISFCWTGVGDSDITAIGSSGYAGGIAGLPPSSYNTISNCVALNFSVIGSMSSKGRIAGDLGGLSNNFGLYDMSGGSWFSDSSGKDGADVYSSDANTYAWWISSAPTGPGWPISSAKSDANEGAPWYWGGTRPKLWFE